MTTIVQLYSDVLSTYGDRGNTLYIQYFLRKHGIVNRVVWHRYGEAIPEADIYVFGGGQDASQRLVASDLQDTNGELLKRYLTTAHCLAICGGYQLLGEYYQISDGSRIQGLGILPIVTLSGKKRFVGKVVGCRSLGSTNRTIVGFENHSGRTFAIAQARPLLQVVSGHGNNAQDGTEGIVLDKIIGTYLHGPVMARNPHLLAWWLRDLLVSQRLRSIDLSGERVAHRNYLDERFTT